MSEYIFYKISCIDKNIIYTYIGSTKNFRRRKCQHKSDCTNEASKKYNITIYKTIRENGGWENWTMSPIGKGIFENKFDALIEEQKYINDNNSTLNTNNARRTKEDNYNYHKQYNEIHKEQGKESNKKYRDTHKEKINEKTTCECGGCYTHKNKARHFMTKLHTDYLTNLQIPKL
jgi:hypothetical protein